MATGSIYTANESGWYYEVVESDGHVERYVSGNSTSQSTLYSAGLEKGTVDMTGNSSGATIGHVTQTHRAEGASAETVHTSTAYGPFGELSQTKTSSQSKFFRTLEWDNDYDYTEAQHPEDNYTWVGDLEYRSHRTTPTEGDITGEQYFEAHGVQTVPDPSGAHGGVEFPSATGDSVEIGTNVWESSANSRTDLGAPGANTIRSWFTPITGPSEDYLSSLSTGDFYLSESEVKLLEQRRSRLAKTRDHVDRIYPVYDTEAKAAAAAIYERDRRLKAAGAGLTERVLTGLFHPGSFFDYAVTAAWGFSGAAIGRGWKTDSIPLAYEVNGRYVEMPQPGPGEEIYGPWPAPVDPEVNPPKPQVNPPMPQSGEPAAPKAGVKIRNAHIAGQTHPRTGIPFDKYGFPDFSSIAIAEVKITPTGTRPGDLAAANELAGFPETPNGFTWHHHQDGTTMQLVPRNIHLQTGHTGGFFLGGN
ncbi:MAG: HNH endonuclease [Pirellulales bacterium]